LWVEVKRTKEKHTNRIGFLTGTIADKINIDWYIQWFQQFGKIGFDEMELKRQVVHKGLENE